MSTILTEDQIEAAYLLVAGETATDVAIHLKVNIKTIVRWKRDPAFQAEMKRHADTMRTHLHDRLIRLADRALDALEHELLNGKDYDRNKKAMCVLAMLGMSNFTLPEEAPTPPSAPAGQK